MFKIIINLTLVFASIYSAFFLIKPQFGEISFLKTEIESYKENLKNIERVRELRDKYLESYNKISEEDKERIKQMMPNSINEGEMVLMIDGIAKANNLSLDSITFSKKEKQTSPVLDLEKQQNYYPYSFSISLTGSYSGFKNFLKDFERSLLIIDTNSITFISSKDSLKGGDIYGFNVEANIYLKQ